MDQWGTQEVRLFSDDGDGAINANMYTVAVSLLCGLWSACTWETFTSSKEAVPDPLPKTSAVWLVDFSCVTVTESLKMGTVNNTRYGMC